jgi:hypothetical protein
MMWTDFAKTSDPTPARSGLPYAWTKYQEETPLYLEITLHPGTHTSLL